MQCYLSALLMCDSICCQSRSDLNLLSSGFYTLKFTWSTCNTEPEQITIPSSFLPFITLPPSTKIMRPRIISTTNKNYIGIKNAYLSYKKKKTYNSLSCNTGIQKCNKHDEIKKIKIHAMCLCHILKTPPCIPRVFNALRTMKS